MKWLLENIKILVAACLVILYSIYTIVVYTSGTENPGNRPEMTAQAVKGKLLWQKNNCAACHQIYGLGGYMGPDLTNIMTAPGKGEEFARVIITYGTGKMPAFHFSDEEVTELISYLHYVDSTGFYPLKNYRFTAYGSLRLKGDDEN